MFGQVLFSFLFFFSLVFFINELTSFLLDSLGPKPTYYIAVDRNMKRPNLKEPIRRDDLVANAMNCSNRIKQLKAFHFN